MSAGDAVVAVQAHWEEIKEPEVRKVRRGELDEIAWSSYRLCTSVNPTGSQTSLCGRYESRAEAREAMRVAAEALVEEADWSAVWEPPSGSWQVRAQVKSFLWTFRLVESTGAVEFLTGG